MFGRKSQRPAAIDTLVGPGSKVQGDLVFSGGCHIDGTVHGNVSAEENDDQSTLSIAENGNIEGDVVVPYVVLNGTVKGDVYASERVELRPTARVTGNVYYNLIEMAIGAEINGKLVHKPEAKPEIKPEAKAESPPKDGADTKRMPAPNLSGS
ncbi:MAG: polymer-forming cytoskeletal protein [Pseudomonadota bacterium]